MPPKIKDERQKTYKHKDMVIILPGLTGNHTEGYNVNIIKEALDRGLQPVVVNYRGASEMPLTSPVIYSAGSANDIREPIFYIYKTYCENLRKENNEPISLFLIGSSLGANIMANYLGEEGKNCFIKAACCF